MGSGDTASYKHRNMIKFYCEFEIFNPKIKILKQTRTNFH